MVSDSLSRNIRPFAVAYPAKGFISRRISDKIGRARSWIDVISDMVWLLALLGGVCFCFIPFIIVNSISLIV